MLSIQEIIENLEESGSFPNENEIIKILRNSAEDEKGIEQLLNALEKESCRRADPTKPFLVSLFLDTARLRLACFAYLADSRGSYSLEEVREAYAEPYSYGKAMTTLSKIFKEKRGIDLEEFPF